MNKGKYKVGILDMRKGVALAIALVAIAGTIMVIQNARADTTPLVIVGYVYDTDGTTPVAGATVYVRDQDTGAWGINYTDGSGMFTVDMIIKNDAPWAYWFDGDLLLGTASDGSQSGKNFTYINKTQMAAWGGYIWLNFTLGTPETTKTIGSPHFIKYNYNDSSSNKGYLVSPEVHLPSVGTPVLSFYTWFQIESWDPDDFDQMRIYLSTTGGYLDGTEVNLTDIDPLNPTNISGGGDGSFYGSGTPSGINVGPEWIYKSYDLTDWAGENVTIIFEFDTVDSSYNDWEGWLIDNIRIGTTGTFYDTVEDGTGNWTYTGYWHITDHRSYAGSHAWYYGIEHSYVTDQTEFNFTATGDYTNITYDIWYNGSWLGWENYTGNFTLDGECTHYLTFYAENGTNSEPVRNQTHYVDLTPPSTTFEFGEPTHNLTWGGENYTTIKICTPIWINATDIVPGLENCSSGVEWLNYTVWWNEEAPQDYQKIEEVSIHDNDENDLDKRVGFISAELHMDEECFHEIKWIATDYLGNVLLDSLGRPQESSTDFAVDGTAPTINKTIGEPKYVGLGLYGATNWTWVNCSTPIWFNVTDDGCGGGVGVAQFGIRVKWNHTRWPAGSVYQLFSTLDTIIINDNDENDTNPAVGEISYVFHFTQDCFHEPEIWAIDYVGNNYTFKERDNVDCVPPGFNKTIQKIVALEQAEMNNYTTVREQVWQSFLAPWSYIDAVSVYINGTFIPDTPPLFFEIWKNLSAGPIAVTESVSLNGSYEGWVQLHLPKRLFTEHNELYYLVSGSNAPLFNWNATDYDSYPDGNTSVNETWDFAFKIEYFPIHPYSYPMNYSLYHAVYNETTQGYDEVIHEGLNATWLTTQAKLDLSVWDEGCMGGVGLKSFMYRIWYNDTWHPVDMEDAYCGNTNITFIDGAYWYVAKNETVEFLTIQFHEECEHIIQFRAEDLLGNVRYAEQTHYVDDSPPTLEVEYPPVHGFYYDEAEEKQYVRAGKTFYLNLSDNPECAVGWRNFTFYWRYEYTNFTTPYIEYFPLDGNDTSYGDDLVFMDGYWWWRYNVTGEPSVAITFYEECQHTIYYRYVATDWLDNEIDTTGMEIVWVDEFGPEVYKEHPPCYYDEEWIYLHWADPAWLRPTPDGVPYPFPGDFYMEGFPWMELYPEYGRIYEHLGWLDFDGDKLLTPNDYFYMNDSKYDREGDDIWRLYDIVNITLTLTLWNETYGHMYVEFVADAEGNWTSDFGWIMNNPLGTYWHEVYPNFCNMYNITWSSDIYQGTYVVLNDTETGEGIEWYINYTDFDFILDPVPFIQKCSPITLTAKDMPDILKLVDQFQNVGERADELQLRDNILQWPWDAQPFQVTENVTAINEIWLWLDWDGPANVTIYLHDDTIPFIPGNEIASKTISLTGNSTGEWVKFVFDTPAPVSSGNTYLIDAFRENGSLVHWFHAEEDVYPYGAPYISSEQSIGDWMFAVVAYRPNPCASGIEGIYFGYEYEGIFHPTDENDNTSLYGEVVDIRQYYDWDYINESTFDGQYLWYIYDDELGIHFQEECIHWLYYWAKDNVCHHTNVTMQVYHVDEYNPVVEKEHPDHGWTTPVTVVVDDDHDDGSDAYEGYFEVTDDWISSWWSGNGWLHQYGNPLHPRYWVDKYTWVNFIVTNDDLNHGLVLTLHVEEVTGDPGITLQNGSDVNNFTDTIFVDPGSSTTYPLYVYDNLEFLRTGRWHWWVEVENVTNYLRAGAKINLTAYDPGLCASGIENIYWRYEWNGSEYPSAGHPAAVNGSTLEADVPEIANYWWFIYDDESDIIFDEECRHDLYYFAKDRICHNSTVHHQIYFVDASDPVIEKELPDHGAIGDTTQTLFEDFEQPFGNGWAVVDGSHSSWSIKTDNPLYDTGTQDVSHSGRYAAMAFRSGGSSNVDTWLITPQITIPADGNITFWYRNFYRGSVAFNISVHNTTGAPQTDTSAFVPVWNSGMFSDTEWRHVEVDLSAYAGQDVYIGFHCYYLEKALVPPHPANDGALLIDDVWVGAIHRIAVPFSDDVEGGEDGWTIDDLTVTQDSYWTSVNRIPSYPSGTPNVNAPPAPSMNCYDGSMGNGYQGLGQYACNWNDTLTLKNPINLSDANMSDDVLMDFILWHQLGSGDTLYVEASIDGENWTVLTTYTGNSTTWLTPSINLSDYRGNATVWIRFRFVSDDSGASKDAGVFIDNFTIYNSTTTWILDTFENPWTNWVALMLETSQWHIVDGDYYSYNHSWWCGVDSTGYYLNCMEDALVSPPIDLTGYTGYSATLMFWHDYDLEPSSDYGFVDISTNGGSSWTTLASYTGEREWVQEFIDLTSYIGQTVQLRFRFFSDSSDSNYDGWFVDDVVLEIREYGMPVFEDDFDMYKETTSATPIPRFPPTGPLTEIPGTNWTISGYYAGNPWYGWEQYGGAIIGRAHIHGLDSYATQDEYLISPIVYNLPKFSNLTFKHRLSDNSGATAYVYIWVDGAGPYSLATLSDTGDATVVTDISLWDYYGHDIQIGFRWYKSSSYTCNPYSKNSGDWWMIDWVNITSIGFLREGAPINLTAYDRPLDSECEAGVSAIYWRYAYGEHTFAGFGDKSVSGSSIPGMTPDDWQYYYDWYVFYDNGVYDTDYRQGYINVTIWLEGECVHDLWYFAKDTLCHSSDLHYERWYVDGTAPETWFNISWGNHPWIPRNSDVGEDYWYKPGESSGGWPDVICINDDVHFYADHWGSEPCIYPYNHTDRTYYRWEWWNPETEQFEWYPTSATPGAINGSTITVSDHEEYIQYNGNDWFWHDQTPPDGGYIWWMPYTEPFYFTEGCNHTLYFFSKDDLCNTEEPNEWYVGVDDEAPDASIEFDNSSSGSWIFYGEDDTIYFQNCTWFIINATDYPNNTDCQTGIWKIDYTVWRWVTHEMEIDLLDHGIAVDTIYIGGDAAGAITNWIDQDGDGNWTLGDYMYIEWLPAYYGIYSDGWYRVMSIEFDGIYTLLVREVFGNAGEWEVLLPWQTLYTASLPYSGYDGFDGPSVVAEPWYDYYGREYIKLGIHLGDLLYNLTGATFNCGKYEIHWKIWDYNNMTVGERKQDVAIDCTPPRTTKEFGEPVIEQTIAGGETIHWVSADTKIWLNGTDDFVWDSGVNETWYKFWNEDPILLWKRGMETFEQPYYPGVYSTSKQWFTVSEAVQIMGYDSIYDYFMTNPNVAGQRGNIELYHWSVDNVGHVEDWYESKQHIWVDDLPPESRVDDIIPWEREDTPVYINVTDIVDYGYEWTGPVGVCKVDIYYKHSIDNETWGSWVLYDTYIVDPADKLDVPDYMFAFDAPEGGGYYRFASIAYDCLGNQENDTHRTYYPDDYDAWCYIIRDRDPPEVSKTDGQPSVAKVVGEETIYILTWETPVYVTVVDQPDPYNASGVNELYITFEIPGPSTHWEPISKTEWIVNDHGINGYYNISYTFILDDYKTIFDLQEGELYHMYFKAIDVEDNEVEYKAQKFIVDETAPTTNITLDCTGEMPFNITVTATDAHAGVATITLWFRYSPDGENWTEWMEYGSVAGNSTTFEFIYNPDDGYYKPGYYEFYASAEDNLGNSKGAPTAEAECYVSPIPEDFNGDGMVNVLDLYEIIVHWGETGEPGWIPQDLNNDGVIGADDIYMLILKWTG